MTAFSFSHHPVRPRILSIIFSVALMACARDAENPVEPPPFEPSLIDKGMGLIRVSIEVTGDAKLGSDSYSMRLDGNLLGVPIDTGTVIETLAGRHVIDFGYPEDRLWCTVIGAGSQVFDVTKGGLTNVRFKIYCPALDGTGTLVVRVEDYTMYCYDDWPICDFEARHGTEQPMIRLERTNGVSITFTTNAAMWKDLAISLDAGTYRITTMDIPGCNTYPPPDAAVHADKIVRRDLIISCY